MRQGRNGRGSEEPQQGASWMTTFNDLITLLMVFFVLLFTMSTIDVMKLKDFKGSLQSGLGVLKEGEQVSVELITRPKVETVEETAEPTADQKETMSPRQMIENLVKALNRETGVGASYAEQGVVIRLEDAILFEFGKAHINPNAYPLLEKMTGMIDKIPGYIRVEGHTDNVAIHTERFPSNWELSMARAISVVKHFIEVGKIPPQRLSAVGYGESKPLFPNDTVEHRAKNRRVEIVLVEEDS